MNPTRQLLLLVATLAALASAPSPRGFPGHPDDKGPISIGPKGMDSRLGEIYPGRPPGRVEQAADHARYSSEPLAILHEGSACDVDLDCVTIQTSACGDAPVASNIGFYQLIADKREVAAGDVDRDCAYREAPIASCREGYCLLPAEQVFERFPPRVPHEGGWIYTTPARRHADRWWGGEKEVAFAERHAMPPPPPEVLRRAAQEFGQAVNAWAPAAKKRQALEAELEKWESALDATPLPPVREEYVRSQRATARDALYELPEPGTRPDPTPPHQGMACDQTSECVVLAARPCGGEPVAASVSWQRAVGSAYERLRLPSTCKDPFSEPSATCTDGYCTLAGHQRDLPARHPVEGGFAYDDAELQAPFERWKQQRQHMRTP